MALIKNALDGLANLRCPVVGWYDRWIAPSRFMNSLITLHFAVALEKSVPQGIFESDSYSSSSAPALNVAVKELLNHLARLGLRLSEAISIGMDSKNYTQVVFFA